MSCEGRAPEELPSPRTVEQYSVDARIAVGYCVNKLDVLDRGLATNGLCLVGKATPDQAVPNTGRDGAPVIEATDSTPLRSPLSS